jgi:hypothetical protein
MLREAKRRAKKRGTAFTLSVDDIFIPRLCPVLGIELFAGGLRDHAPSLDAIVPSNGYVVGNVQVMSCLANRMKNSATESQLRQFALWVLGQSAGKEAQLRAA